MYLKHDEVVVTPPTYRLFDCMRVRVCLIPENEKNAEDEESLWRAKITVGMIPQDNHVEAMTDSFLMGNIPRRKGALHYWHRVQARVPNAKLGRSILVYLKQNVGIQVEFPITDEEMRSFIVHLGAFQVVGQLPEGFSMLTYFGETSRLED